MVEIHQLYYFSRAAETLNFSRAAAELFISRQALTKSIQTLEKELDQKLFNVKNGKLSLTPSGAMTQLQCRGVLESYNAMLAEMECFSPGKTHGLFVAAAVGTVLSLPVNCIQQFCDTHPEVQFTLEQASTDSILKMVRDGVADLGLVGSMPAYLTGFSTQLLVQSGTYVGICPGHPLYGHSSLTIQDLKGQPFVTAGTNNHLHHLLEQECHNAGFSPSVAFMSSSADVLVHYAIAHGMLFFSFADWSCQTEDGPIKVVALNVPGGDAFGTYLIWKDGSALGQIPEQFLSWLLELTDR